MCAIDSCDPATLWSEKWRTARKPHRCEECDRIIAVSERYRFVSALTDGHWSDYRTCAHCAVAGRWLDEVCGGYPSMMLREELFEHWHEGFRSIPFGRLAVGQKLRWHDGRDPVPDGAAVAELARQMMRAQVAS